MIIKYTQEEYDTATSKDKLPLECEKCGKIFYASKKEITFELSHNRGRLKYCSVQCSDEAHRKRHHIHCEECGKEIEVLNCDYQKSESKHFFCSLSCAVRYNNRHRKVTDEQKEKIKKSLEKHFRKKHINKKYKCIVCGREYELNEDGATRKICSRECYEEYKNNLKKYLSDETIEKLRAAGRKSAKVQSENRRSKNEILFCELCEKKFNNVKHNEPMFNGWDADVIIEDIKYAILWNGKWHYEKLKESHSVAQVQNRDRIKIEEIKKAGYKPYVIKDMGKFKPEFVENEFKKFIESLNN